MKVVVLSFAALTFGMDVAEKDFCAFANYAKLAEASSDFPDLFVNAGWRSGNSRKKSLGRKKGRSKDVRRSKVLRELRRQPKTRKQARYFYETTGQGF